MLKICYILKGESEAAGLNLEASGGTELFPFNFRPFGSLLSDEAREEGARLLLTRGMTVKTWTTLVEKIAHRQWVNFHWRPGSPFIDRARRMPSPVLSVATHPRNLQT